MTVIIDDTTEYESQDNGLAEMAVREVKGVARSVRVALSELYKKDISSVLPWLLRCWPDHARTDWSRWVDTASKTERESIPRAASCLCRVRSPSPHRQESKWTPEALKRWFVLRDRREELGILRWHRRASSKSETETTGRKSECGAP